ncbi:DIP1984 family protein [uncultured Leptotrichia sp.]|jgi:septicolysin|uniref:DIP1984 family protein n=1 Tax=uncultured Leptotrichia sp. TaxID=159271 RepID=UPI0025E3F718|nr:DIP1984 family protein [uncultured Leptotrichia sp.]
MKIAEALILRADIQKRIAQLRTRLNNNAKVQENEEPAENPELLLTELENLILQLNDLIVKINRTNTLSKIDGISLVELIAKKDTLSQKAGILREFIEIASQKVDLYSTTEIKVFSTVNVSEQQKKLDKLSKEIRETDTKLQQANWTIDLVEE